MAANPLGAHQAGSSFRRPRGRKAAAILAGVPWNSGLGTPASPHSSRNSVLVDLLPEAPSFITRVCGSGFHIRRRRFGQARRARYAAGIIGDKWCFLLMRDVLVHGKRTYGEFASSPEGISTNILALRLNQLVESGLLVSQPDPRKGSRKCYFPTTKFRDLIPALLSIMAWSARYDPETEAPDSFTRSFERDPAGMIARYERAVDQVDNEILDSVSTK